ncbi:MAG: AAA family ATPase [Ruminococcus sp.]
MPDVLKLPIGIESFEKIRKEGFYYIDKTRLIEQLLNQWEQISLLGPGDLERRLINMSMLRYFFEIGTDKTLFDGLYISRSEKLCDEYLGKYPVVFISLKNVDGLTFEDAQYQLVELVGIGNRAFSFPSRK